MNYFIGELMTYFRGRPEFGQSGDVFKIVDIHFNGKHKANQIQQSGQTAKYVTQKNIHAEHLFQDEQKKGEK